MSEITNSNPDVEGEICDLANMARLASKLVEDMNQYGTRPDGSRGIWLTDDACELLAFAVYNLEKRAKELRTKYCGC